MMTAMTEASQRPTSISHPPPKPTTTASPIAEITTNVMRGCKITKPVGAVTMESGFADTALFRNRRAITRARVIRRRFAAVWGVMASMI